MAKTILIVDDSASLRNVVSIALKREGYDVIEAENGLDGLTKAKQAKINLIVSDVNMPNMDGLSMIEEIKKDPASKFIPVIMLTTESDAEMKDKGKQVGVKAWMVKPFKPEQMVDAIAKLMMP